MQYVGKVGDYVYNQWNSLNPATLSGAIDIIVIEQPDGSLHCSPWHVRFGKFQIIKPLQKKIDLYVNDIKTDMPMKLSDGGEAFFVFETDAPDLSSLVVTSPVISAASSPSSSPRGSPRGSPPGSPSSAPEPSSNNDPDPLDLNGGSPPSAAETELKISLNRTSSPPPSVRDRSETPTLILRLAFERAKKITQKLNIPSKIDINGDMVLDMDGYKPNSQKNINESDELVRKVFFKEMHDIVNSKETPENLASYASGENELSLLQGVIREDKDGKIRIMNCASDEESIPENDIESTENLFLASETSTMPALKTNTTSASASSKNNDKTYFKTLRLTSEQLASMKLKPGRNKLKFRLNLGTSQVVSDLYLWKSTTPIVISDIDGTITKSDALGHVLNMFGKDWTHPGVATLFQDINQNGYNIVYLTARSVGQADTTRQYLESISQDGVRLPKGPVILSPDRTMAALKREIILKKPEVFKMACLRDINSLYFSASNKNLDDDDDRTPFYAGFGNRITDAISYRSVKIPSHRIFTINPYGEVHMELLELAGYRSSYLHIGELVDHFFPPLKLISDVDYYWNQNQFDQYIQDKRGGSGADASVATSRSPGSPTLLNSPRSLASGNDEIAYRPDEKFTDLNYWREPMAALSDFSDLEDDESEPEQLKLSPSSPKGGTVPQPGSPELYSVKSYELEKKQQERKVNLPILGEPPGSPSKSESQLGSSFTSPLKNFMMFGGRKKDDAKKEPGTQESGEAKAKNYDNGNDEDEEDEDDEDDDDYTDDYDDDYTDDDYDEDEEEEEEEEDEDDLDLDDGLPGAWTGGKQPLAEITEAQGIGSTTRGSEKDVDIVKASDMLKQVKFDREKA